MSEEELYNYVRDYFLHCPETGMLIGKKKQSRRSKIGEPVGWLQKNGYHRISIKQKSYQAHRLVWLYHYGAMPCGDIDHINGNKSDNRLDNLRDVPHAHNTQNRTRLHARNKTGYRGVTKSKNGYEARIWLDSTSVKLGEFADPELAELVYLEAKAKHHDGCAIW